MKTGSDGQRASKAVAPALGSDLREDKLGVFKDLGKLNPTVMLEVHFEALSERGTRMRTVFRLQEEPDVVRWLSSFVDHILARQGKIGGGAKLADPPEGPARDELIRGRVLLVKSRLGLADQLLLNHNLAIGLGLNLRLADQPARRTPIWLHNDPELAGWLLNFFVGGTSAVDLTGPSESLKLRLRRHGVFVDGLPAPDVFFPDPDASPMLDENVATASRVVIQRAGETLPATVAQVLGRRQPALPPDTDLLWTEDAGTGIVLPARLPEGVGPEELASVVGAAATARKERWQQQIEDATHTLSAQRYAILRSILPEAHRKRLLSYCRELVHRRYFPELGDGTNELELRSGIQNEPTAASIHHGLAALVSRVCGEKVKPSYCLLSCYEAGAELPKHKDRPECIYNLSIVYDMSGPDGEPDPWPIFLELDGRPVSVELKIGDGVLYSGTDINHWREALPDQQRAVICFYHFVPEDYDGSLA